MSTPLQITEVAAFGPPEIRGAELVVKVRVASGMHGLSATAAMWTHLVQQLAPHLGLRVTEATASRGRGREPDKENWERYYALYAEWLGNRHLKKSVLARREGMSHSNLNGVFAQIRDGVAPFYEEFGAAAKPPVLKPSGKIL